MSVLEFVYDLLLHQGEQGPRFGLNLVHQRLAFLAGEKVLERLEVWVDCALHDKELGNRGYSAWLSGVLKRVMAVTLVRAQRIEIRESPRLNHMVLRKCALFNRKALRFGVLLVEE